MITVANEMLSIFRIIAMSFPSSGCMSWYRNPIRDVALFLDKKHGEHYRVSTFCLFKSFITFFNVVLHFVYPFYSFTIVLLQLRFTIFALSEATMTFTSTDASRTGPSTTTTCRPSTRWSTSSPR